MLMGLGVEEINALTGIDPWFLEQMAELIAAESWYAKLVDVDAEALRTMKSYGFSDRQLGALRGETEEKVRKRRWSLGVRPAYKMVDTCAGEFPSATPYLYGTYDEESEAPRSGRRSIIILGSGPNRIGQGVEFDYCCVRAALALRDAGFETIMINSNPETVSTDFDTSDKLYFEPLTFEDVFEIVEREQPIGVIVQLGGQTPLKLTRGLEAAGVTILGTSPDAIDIAEDRRRFEAIARKLEIHQPPNGTATNAAAAIEVAERIGYPVLVRPSYVLGGRAMEIVYDDDSLRQYFEKAILVSEDRPVLIDRFLEDAYEVDVDAICDGKSVVIGGVMQHIEDAGIHSGDSACVLPPYIISEKNLTTMREHTAELALALGVVGLINVQFAIKDGTVYVLEVNPRASRTIPFVSKAIGVPLASLAARVMAGETLAEVGFTEEIIPGYVAVKEAVFPFDKFRGADPILGPEMRSTGEVMGISDSFGSAFAKAQLAAGNGLPTSGAILVTVNDTDKATVAPIVRRFHEMGFRIYATTGTARFLKARGIPVESVLKVHEGRPNCMDLIVDGEVQMLINTPLGKHSQRDDYSMRRAAVAQRVSYTTTMSAASAAADAVMSLRFRTTTVRPLQEWHALMRAADPR
jgi:carbamoyl-phosphate synthase large subunit